MIATLHIEHQITDFASWKAAFDRFVEARERAGVMHARIRLQEDDASQIVIDLDFASAEAAQAFSRFLHDNVWKTPNAPALVGAPSTRILIEPAGSLAIAPRGH